MRRPGERAPDRRRRGRPRRRRRDPLRRAPVRRGRGRAVPRRPRARFEGPRSGVRACASSLTTTSPKRRTPGASSSSRSSSTPSAPSRRWTSSASGSSSSARSSGALRRSWPACPRSSTRWRPASPRPSAPSAAWSGTPSRAGHPSSGNLEEARQRLAQARAAVAEGQAALATGDRPGSADPHPMSDRRRRNRPLDGRCRRSLRGRAECAHGPAGPRRGRPAPGRHRRPRRVVAPGRGIGRATDLGRLGRRQRRAGRPRRPRGLRTAIFRSRSPPRRGRSGPPAGPARACRAPARLPGRHEARHPRRHHRRSDPGRAAPGRGATRPRASPPRSPAPGRRGQLHPGGPLRRHSAPGDGLGGADPARPRPAGTWSRPAPSPVRTSRRRWPRPAAREDLAEEAYALARQDFAGYGPGIGWGGVSRGGVFPVPFPVPTGGGWGGGSAAVAASAVAAAQVAAVVAAAAPSGAAGDHPSPSLTDSSTIFQVTHGAVNLGTRCRPWPCA